MVAIAASAAGLYLATCLLAGVFLAEGAVRPGRRHVTEADRNSARSLAAELRSTCSDVEIPAGDGVSLRGWLLTAPADAPERGAVVALHGVGDSRAGMLGFARIFLESGFTVLLPDSRAHGASGGELATYGLLEAGDVAAWRQWLQQTRRPRCIFGLGESMGAALLLQSLDTQPAFCGVVAESAFASFREIAYDRLGQPFRTGPWLGRTVLRPVVESGIVYARLRYGLDLDAASPEDAIVRSTVPVLIVHGAEDTSIPLRHALRISRRRGSIALWQVPGCAHTGARTTAPEEFTRRVVGWFERCAAKMQRRSADRHSR